MVKIFAGAAVAAALLTTPAMAQSYWSTMGTGNVVTFNPVENYNGQIGSTGEFAYEPTQRLGQRAMAQQPYAPAHYSRHHRRAW
jgi:hypothetical protein